MGGGGSQNCFQIPVCDLGISVLGTVRAVMVSVPHRSTGNGSPVHFSEDPEKDAVSPKQEKIHTNAIYTDPYKNFPTNCSELFRVCVQFLEERFR